MRSLSLYLFAVGMALGASAQGSQSTTTQTGSGNTASTTQTGTYHVAQVVQANGATASVQQGVSAASIGNWAFVRQDGASTATVVQSGNNDQADVAQRGNGNIATLTQSGSGNLSLIYQGRSGWYFSHPGFPMGLEATNNLATVHQQGNNNRGADANQLHDEDGGLVYQGVRGGSAVGNTASVPQTGDNGQAWTSQGDEFGSSTTGQATITQAGIDNDASAVQGYYAFSSATSSIASIEQMAGSARNMTVVFQGVDGTSHTDRAEVTQSGFDHRSSVFQGVADPIFATQAGTASSSGNVAVVVQEMTGNTSFIYQGTGDGGFASQSTALVTQLSDGNLSTVTQSGTGNHATVLQE